MVEYHKALVTKILRDWGFDGLKLDGQHMNGAPRCYNPAHHHASPEDSVEAVPQFFKAIYDTALSVKPDALVEFCPCGTGYSFFTIPFMNMLGEKFPRAQFLITGVLGPHSNAHGPNEFLHIPYVKQLTAAVASIVAAAE